MSFLRYALVASSFLVPVFTQDEQPSSYAQITDGASPDGNCDGCYVVADVAAVVFGSGFVTQLNTEIVHIQTGKNGSYVTTSSIVGSAQLSLAPDSAIGGSIYSLSNNPTIIFSGQTLISPTAYQIFTAYSVTRSYLDGNNKCQISRGERSTVPNPYKVEIPASQDSSYIVEAERRFIASISLTCTPGGQSAKTITFNSGTQLTTTLTSIGPLRFTPQPLSAPSVQTPNFPISTGLGNYSTGASFSISPYTGAGPSFSTSFSQSTLPLMALGALSILLAAAAL